MELTFRDLIDVEGLHSFHYFEFTRSYAFSGESHPFWEFQYVDKGQYTVTADGIAHRMKQGDAIFHRPNEYHSGLADGKTNPNLLVVSFSGTKLEGLAGTVVSVTENEREHLTRIVELARKNFAGALDNERIHKLELSEHASPYELNELKLRLELFLLSCLKHANRKSRAGGGYRGTMERVAMYLQSSLKNGITLDDVEARFHLNRDYLNRLFKQKYGSTIIDYFVGLKIDAAKDYLRSNELSVKEISRQLGYADESYFCRQFLRRTGFTPTEYRNSVDPRRLSDRQ